MNAVSVLKKALNLPLVTNVITEMHADAWENEYSLVLVPTTDGFTLCKVYNDSGKLEQIGDAGGMPIKSIIAKGYKPKEIPQQDTLQLEA